MIVLVFPGKSCGPDGPEKRPSSQYQYEDLIKVVYVYRLLSPDSQRLSKQQKHALQTSVLGDCQPRTLPTKDPSSTGGIFGSVV